MKKRITKTLVVAIALLLIFTSGVYAGANWPWSGSENVTNIKTNLSGISQKIQDLKNKETTLREQYEGELAGKQQEIQNKIDEINEKIDEINEKNQVINEKNAEINQLKEKADQVDGLTAENNSLKNQLAQALSDVQEIEQITQGMIE